MAMALKKKRIRRGRAGATERLKLLHKKGTGQGISTGTLAARGSATNAPSRNWMSQVASQTEEFTGCPQHVNANFLYLFYIYEHYLE